MLGNKKIKSISKRKMLHKSKLSRAAPWILWQISKEEQIIFFSQIGNSAPPAFSHHSDAVQICSQKEWKISCRFVLNAHVSVRAEKDICSVCSTTPSFTHLSVQRHLIIAFFLHPLAQFQRVAVSRNIFLYTTTKSGSFWFRWLVFGFLLLAFSSHSLTWKLQLVL